MNRSTDHTKAGSAKPGVRVEWGVTHRTGGGRLISRQASINPPDPPTCLRPSCLWKYLKDAVFYALLASYHARRVAYAESHYYVADRVVNSWKIRRAGIDPATGEKWPYEQSYSTPEAAGREIERIHNQVLPRYRVGEPQPQTIWQAVHANIKLKCPACRRYDVDPLLFRM